MKCEQCGVEFKAERKSRRFCSNECKVDARRSQVERTCLVCGRDFTVQPNQGAAKYCSRECRFTGLTKEVTNATKLDVWRRFVAVKGRDECWLWTGSISNGYGLARIGAKFQVSSHRLSYELFSGPIPAGARVCHHCDNPPCCNPHHLFAGSDADNLKDMVNKGRQSRGEHRPTSKLTDAEVRSIRSSSKSQSELAKLYGVDQSAISRIVSKKNWRHVA